MSAPTEAYLMKLESQDADHFVAAKLDYGGIPSEYDHVIKTKFHLDEYLVVRDDQTGQEGFIGAVRVTSQGVPFSSAADHHNLATRRGKLTITTVGGVEYALLNDAGLNTYPDVASNQPIDTPRKNYIKLHPIVTSAHYAHTTSYGIDVMISLAHDTWQTAYQDTATIPPNQIATFEAVIDPSAASSSNFVRYRAWAVNAEGKFISSTVGVETNGVSVFWRKVKRYINIADKNPGNEFVIFMDMVKYAYLTNFISGNPGERDEFTFPSDAYLYAYTTSSLNVGVISGYYQNVINDEKVRIKIDTAGRLVSFRRLGAPYFNTLSIANTLYPSTPNDRFYYMVGSVTQTGSNLVAIVTFGYNNFDERTFYHYNLRINNPMFDSSSVRVEITDPRYGSQYNGINPTKLRDYTEYTITLSAYPSTGPTDWYLQIM